MLLTLRPAIIITFVDPEGDPGSGRPLAKSRLAGRFGTSLQEKLLPAMLNSQESPVPGPETSVRPLGITVRCG